jgi:hypothetical protein|tara:strand:- start:618 stop:734 length:117 start_codon:yes stop_codon:yes gene_type:complete
MTPIPESALQKLSAFADQMLSSISIVAMINTINLAVND